MLFLGKPRINLLLLLLLKLLDSCLLHVRKNWGPVREEPRQNFSENYTFSRSSVRLFPYLRLHCESSDFSFSDFNMRQLKPEEFMLKPSLEVFESLTKDDLFSLGKHLELEVKKSMRKDQIQNIIIKHLVGLKVFESAALAESFATSDTELRKLELELELKKLEMQRERELKEQEFKKREMERDRQEKEKERELVWKSRDWIMN